MSGPLERLAATVASAIPELLNGAVAGVPRVLPRGADPFTGAHWPLLLTATRWTAVSPGGVLIGGAPDAVASVLGFELPERPVVSAENEVHQRRATDRPDGEAAADATG
ncbi:MAG: hypothetical protein QM679_04305, partial [Patulibacter sp.]